MKLIIQIPCYNEEKSLPITLAALPRSVPGFDRVEWLIIDDGSQDQTVAVAKKLGVDHIVSYPENQGLAKAFIEGLRCAVLNGADVIVNTDADNQYNAADIPLLVAPILERRAEIVVGARPISATKHFSLAKKILQKLGSYVVRLVSSTDIPDAPSGFRAMSRSAAMRLNVFNDHTYTLETIIQAGRKGISITSVPIRTNADMRPSRLVKSIPSYIRRSLVTMLRIFMAYRPLHFFALPGITIFLIGLAFGMRFLYHYVTSGGAGHIQSLILTALLLGTGFFLCVVALIADLISFNRQLLEKNEWYLQQIQEKLRAD